jgi:hypothetical protein
MGSIGSALLRGLERLFDLSADIRRALHDVNPGSLHRCHLLGGSSLPACDNRSGVSHPAAGRRGLSGNEPDHRLGHVIADERGSLLFSRSTNFLIITTASVSDHLERAERVDETGANNRISADSDGGRLPKAEFRELMHGFISERPLRDTTPMRPSA